MNTPTLTFKFRPIDCWVNVEFDCDDHHADLGLHNRAEVEEFARILREAADQAEHWIDVVDPRSKCS